MPTIQVKDVPAEVHAVLHRRAAAAGQSLQEFVLSRLREEALRPSIEELFERIGHRSGGKIGLKAAARAVRSDREAR